MTNYIRGLDGLRAVAILWVMLGHVSAASKWEAVTGYQKAFTLVASAGWVGVQLFFVISGFLITKILLKDKGKPKQLSHFYMRRSLRIFPIYYLTLATLFIIIPALGYTLEWLSQETEHQAWYWTYMNNWIRPYIYNKGLPHLWSLAIEEQYYLIWPFFVIFLQRKWLIGVCAFMVISAPIFRYLLFYFYQTDLENVGPRAAYNFTFARWDAIALGSLLAILAQSDQALSWLKQHQLKLFIGSSLLILLQVAFTRTFNAVGEGGFELLNQTYTCVLFFIVVFFVATNDQLRLINWLEFSPVKLIGKYSYAMYIFHLPIMVAWFSYFAPDYTAMSSIQIFAKVLINFVIIFSISFILSMLSWHLFEYPILKLKRFFQ